ncbi:MAG TPA: hypothetical protein EYG57_10485 [Planctomycetes bacterium]|nr:hypothetical protein [Planctomycetota bacterium]
MTTGLPNSLMALLLAVGMVLIVGGLKNTPEPDDGEHGPLSEPKFGVILEREYKAHSFSVPPLVIGDRMILADYEGHVMSVRLESGEIDWEFQGDDLGYEAPLVHEDNRLYAIAAEGFVDCIDLETGESHWTVDCDATVSAPPLVVGDVLLIGTQSAELICLDKLSGDERWRFHAGDQIHAVPRVVDNQILVVAACSRTMHIVNLKTGVEIRQIELPGETVAPFTVNDNLVYVTTMYGDAVCYDWQNTKQLWSYSFNPEIQPTIAGGPSIVGEVMYVGGSDSFLRAFNITTRKEIWRRRIKGSVEVPLAIGQDLVIAVTPRGRVYAVDCKTGEIRWQYESNGSIIASPVIVDNTIVFANNDDKVYRFGPLTSLQ